MQAVPGVKSQVGWLQLDNYRALKLSPGGVRVFLGLLYVPLDSGCPFLCAYEPDAWVCFQGLGTWPEKGPLGTEV